MALPTISPAASTTGRAGGKRMNNSLFVVGMAFPWLLAAVFGALGAWIGFQLVHQNGRLLARLEALEQRLAELAARPAPAVPSPAVPAAQPAAAPPPPQGLPLGSPAPAFALPDLAGDRK